MRGRSERYRGQAKDKKYGVVDFSASRKESRESIWPASFSRRISSYLMRKRQIVMVGTALDTQGGVSATVNVLKTCNLFDRCNILYIASHRDGSAFVKLGTALTGWLKYVALILSGRVALLHVHMASRASFWRKAFFLFPSIVLRVPVIVHLHGAEFQHYYGVEALRPTKMLIRRVFSSASRVIVLSNGWRDWVESICPDARTMVLHNPVALPRRTSYESRDVSTLLFLGRIGRRKGILDLIEAVARLRARFPDIMLLVGGDGDPAKAEQLAETRGIARNVEFLGWVSGEAKQGLLAKATIYVLPSYAEGLPMSVLEAMAAGLPIVATPVGGVPEAVTDGTEGFLVHPGSVAELENRLEQLLDDPLLRAQMGQAARRKAEALFAVESIAPALEALYAEVSLAVKHNSRRIP